MSISLEAKLKNYVANEISFRDVSKLAFIIGRSPSSGARSPRLWNSAFAANGLDAEMYPLDVETTSFLRVLEILETDNHIVGVAIAAPYKSVAAQIFPARLSITASMSGSVNLLYRSMDGKLTGENTDGLGAMESLRRAALIPNDRKVLILGCGGTGRAVIAALLTEIDRSRLLVAMRSDAASAWLTSLGISGISFSEIPSHLNQIRLVINCTTVGWGEDEGKSPLSEDVIDRLDTATGIFDVIYQPLMTKLLVDAAARGLRTLGGKEMNLLQAVLAFKLANPQVSEENIRSAMQRVV